MIIQTLYHYTTEEGYKEILKTGLKVSTPWTTMDSAYGIGWYFTDLEPSKCEMLIANKCWRKTTPDVLARCTHYLKYEFIEPSSIIKTREHVFMVPYTPNTNSFKLTNEHGKTGDCKRKPCQTCKIGERYRIE